MTFQVAKKVKTSPKDVGLNELKKPRGRNSQPELDKEGSFWKGSHSINCISIIDIFSL